MGAHEPTSRMGAGKIGIQNCFSRSPKSSDASHPKILSKGSSTLMNVQDLPPSEHAQQDSLLHSSFGGHGDRQSIFSREVMFFHSVFTIRTMKIAMILKPGTSQLHHDRIKTKGDISKEIIYIHCKTTEDHKTLKGQKYHRQGLHFLFLNSVSPHCPHKFAAQLPRSFGNFFTSFISLLFLPLNNKRKQVQLQYCQKAKVSAKRSHTYSLSTAAEGLAFKISPILGHQPKPPFLHYV